MVRAGLVAVAALLLACEAQAGVFVRAKRLEPAASFVARKPVRVMCARTDHGWRGFLASRRAADVGSHGAAYPGGTVAYFEPFICDVLLAASRPNEMYVGVYAPAIQVLTHEAMHLRGFADEGVAECRSMKKVGAVAVRFFHVKAGSRKLRNLLAEARRFHQRAPAEYRGRC